MNMLNTSDAISFVKSYLLEKGFVENKNPGFSKAKSFVIGENFIEVIEGNFNKITIEVFSSSATKLMNCYEILDGVSIFGKSLEKLAEDLSKIIH